jgi:hypothetical protein
MPGGYIMSTSSDDRKAQEEAQIDAWVEEQIALSPTWSAEKWESILALLKVDEPKYGDT